MKRLGKDETVELRCRKRPWLAKVRHYRRLFIAAPDVDDVDASHWAFAESSRKFGLLHLQHFSTDVVLRT